MVHLICLVVFLHTRHWAYFWGPSLPTVMSFLTTFLALHFLASGWYLSRFSIVSKMLSSIKSTSLDGCSPWSAAFTLRLQFFSSSRLIASAPNKSPNRVNLFLLDSVVFWDQRTLKSSSARFPFFWSNNHFLVQGKISLFAFSTALLDYGW